MALWLTDTDVPLRRIEHDVTRLLADGLVDDALDLLGAHGPPSPFTELVELDAGCGRLEVGLAELQRLQERLRLDPDAGTRFGLWADALVAERMLLDGDLAASRWAVEVLDRTSDELYPPLAELYARARLQRVAALGILLEPSPANVIAYRSLRDGAMEDFTRCGFHIEAAVTSALAAGFRYLMTQQQPRDTAERVEAARLVVAEVAPSAWQPMLDTLHGMTTLFLGDIPTAVADFDRAMTGPANPLARAVAGLGQAVIGFVGSLGDVASLGAVDDAIAVIRRVIPRHVPTVQAMVAHLLADIGSPEMVRYARPALDAPRLGAMSEPEEHLLRLRVDLQAGVRRPAADAEPHLAALVGLHLGRIAGMHALRLAADFDRLGRHEEGAGLRRRGLDLLPEPAECTPGEVVLSQPPTPVAGTAPRPAPAVVTVRVLGPRLVVDVDGRDVALQPTAARLLLALVIRHPRPMNVEEVADLLWPDDQQDVRSRLNSLVHRLRSTTPALGRSVVRTGNMLTFDESHCRVDLLAYRADLAGSEASRRRALAGVRGNLCEAQFPYDDLFVDERHRFAATWLRHACALPVSDDAEAGDLSPALAALGFESIH